MTTVSSAGIGSGLDVNSIVTQLMAIEQQPLTALQTKATAIQSTVSEYGKIKSDVSTLRDLAIKPRQQRDLEPDRRQPRRAAPSSATSNAARRAPTASRSSRWPACRRSPPSRRLGDRDRRRRHAAHRARHLGRRTRPRFTPSPAPPPSTSRSRPPTRWRRARQDQRRRRRRDRDDHDRRERLAPADPLQHDRRGQRLPQPRGMAPSLAFDPSAGVTTMTQSADRGRRRGHRQRPGRQLGRATRSRTSSTA